MSFFGRKSTWSYSDAVLTAIVSITAAYGSVEQKFRTIGYFYILSGLTATAVVAKCLATTLDEAEKTRKKQTDAEEKRLRDLEIEFLRKKTDETARRMLNGILNVLCERFFSTVPQDLRYTNRATLFKCNDCEIDGKHLAIAARSGLHAESTTRWLVDPNDKKKCQGVAGQIWFTQTLQIVVADGEWKEDGEVNGNASYAASLNSTIDQTSRLNVKSKAFMGNVLLVNGKRWGSCCLIPWNRIT